MKTKPKVRLVLASGGARGVAHIGVIERLEQHGYEIIEVVGCSMGAVVGGLYASGDLKAYTNWLLSLNRANVFKLMDFTITKHGFLKGEKVFSAINDLIGPKKIEALPLKFRAIATNVNTGEEVIFERGDLFQALRASVSIPGIFTPVRIGENQYIDGGVVNPLPVNLITKQKNEIIVAVDINGHTPITKPTLKKDPAPSDDKIKLPKLAWPFLNKLGKSEDQEPNLVEILQTSYDHMQNQLIKLRLQSHPPDLLISIPRDVCGVFDFHKTADLITKGHQQFDQAYARYKNEEE